MDATRALAATVGIHQAAASRRPPGDWM